MRSRNTVPQVKNKRTTKPSSYGAAERKGSESLFFVIAGVISFTGRTKRNKPVTNAYDRSVPFLTFVLRNPRPHNFLDESGRQRFVQRKLDCPLRDGVVLQFVLECLDHRGGREQTAMFRERGEPHQHSIVLKCRNPITHRLSSLRWHSRANCLTKGGEGAASR